MQAPPVLNSPPDPVKAERRNWTGWILLAILFALSIGLGGAGKQKDSQRIDSLRNEIRRIAVTQARKSSLPALSQQDENVKSQIDRLLQKIPAKPSDIETVIRVQAQTLAGEKISKADLERMEQSEEGQIRLAAEIYSKSKLTKDQAKSYLQRLPYESRHGSIIAMHIRMKSGDRDAESELSPPWKLGATVLVGLGVFLLFMGSIVGTILYLTYRKQPILAPKGVPLWPKTKLDADIMALRAAQLMGAFLLVQIVSSIVAVAVPSYWRVGVSSTIAFVAMVAAVLLLSRAPIGNVQLSLASLGAETSDFGRKLLWGVGAYVVELPITLLIALISTRLLPFLPDPEHPASTALLQNPSLPTVIGTLVAATLLAPFWEELLFRGLLFPAIARIGKGLVFGAIISSLMFASVHPQGIPAWLALASVGGASCLVAHHTKSLVPSMVMHCLHNLTLLCIAIVLG